MTSTQKLLLIALTCIYFAILGLAPSGPQAIGQDPQVASAMVAAPAQDVDFLPDEADAVPVTNRRYTPLIVASLFVIGYMCNRQKRF